MGDEDSSVRVAVRIRPQIPVEVIDLCHVCTSVTPGEPQVIIGGDKSFTYDYVFDKEVQQQAIYEACVANLIEGALEGYNATVLAYGQTGSGKTFTMGTGFECKIPEEQTGIVPRAIEHLFRGIKERVDVAIAEEKAPPKFNIAAQFTELHNEDIIDLFEPRREGRGLIKIQEDPSGGIVVVGAVSRTIDTEEDALSNLRAGSLVRTTASTQMNSSSSRSHAIFTLIIKQQRIVSVQPLDGDNTSEPSTEFETLTAKFHFVDLAGSERLKRTGATGERAKEGISINCGLLALGNVISALGDKSKKVSHVPYRDSKLTRLLQDSLGGNSQTLMIACISPSDRDFMETLNTLKYANRARNIKNRVTINQDSSSKIIVQLQHQLAQCQLELLEYRQGKRVINEYGEETVNDMFHENNMLETECRNLRTRMKAMQDTIDTQKERTTQVLVDQVMAQWGPSNGNPEVADIIKDYLREIEDLRAKLLESEKTCEILRKRVMRPNPMSPRHTNMSTSVFDVEASPGILEVAKKDILKDKEMLKSMEAQAEEKQRNGEDSEHSDSEESDSDTESEEKEQLEQQQKEDFQMEQLANLTTEINIKEKLVEELETSKQRIEAIKHHYEDKLEQLHTRIKATQAERDKVMATYTGAANPPSDKVRKIRDDYERKISTMQSEMKKLKAGQKKHEKLMKSQTRYEEQMRKLQSEIGDMKRTKVRLMSQMRDENTRHKQAEDKRNREIAQLRKEQLKREGQIKTLEADKRAKEVVLRRKNEEVLHLRKNMRSGMSSKAAGILRPKHNLALSENKTFSPKHAKHKWQMLEKTITKIAMNKQAVATMERDMERQLREREALSHRLEGLRRRLKNATGQADKDDLEEQIENMQTNIDYVQNSIAESQHSIMILEEAKDSFDGTEVNTLVSTVRGLDEARYLIEKLYNMTVNQSYSAAQKLVVKQYIRMDVFMNTSDSETSTASDVFDPGILTIQQSPEPKPEPNAEPDSNPEPDPEPNAEPEPDANPEPDLNPEPDFNPEPEPDANPEPDPEPNELHLKEMDSKVAQLKQENATQEQLLSHMVERHEYDIFASTLTDPMVASMNSLPESTDSSSSSRAQSPTLTCTDNCNGNGSRVLLESSSYTNVPGTLGVATNKIRRRTALPEELLYPGQAAPSATPTLQTPKLESSPESALDVTFRQPLMRVPSAPDTLKFSMLLPRPDSLKSSPNLHRKNYDRQDSLSPRPVRRAAFPNNLLGKPGSMEQGLDASPPNSPTASRRGIVRDENVFSRLTSSTTSSPREKTEGKGIISPYQQGGKASPRAALICTHIAKGHSRAVLAVDATDELLFSASKDRSVKVWDLQTGIERDCLRGHPNNVVKVKYLPQSQLIFSMSSYYVKVFDIRDCSKCVKTLCSSGLTSGSPMSSSLPSRTVELPLGETQLNDMAANDSESILYTASGDRVRVWDLKRLECTGKLSGGHQAAVMCLAVGRISDEEDVVITGSKDHYIKVFEVNRNSGAAVFTPKMNLNPPHYDGIQSLALRGDTLFSGSRDMCIKKWDLSKQEPVLSLNNAHKDWVTGLEFMPGGQMLLSGCRGGILKLWSTEGGSTTPLGEIKAHNDPINAITTNSTRIFTASNSGEVKLWKYPVLCSAMTMSTGHCSQLAL